MVGSSIFFTLILYLALLFGIAYRIDLSKKWRKRITGNPTVYALTLAVYCSAWTFFGSVGAASTYSIEFLTIYIGPLIVAPLLWIIYRKFIRISKAQGITSMSDFISSRYNKSIALNRLVTILLVVGIIPYIALQITGIERGLETVISWGDKSRTDFSFFGFIDMAFVVTVGLGLFLIAFTTRKLQDKSQNQGMMGAIAFESIVKLVVFVVFGIYVCYYIFDDQSQVYALIPDGELKLNTSNTETRCRRGHHRAVAHGLAVVGDQVDQLVAVLAELFGGHGRSPLGSLLPFSLSAACPPMNPASRIPPMALAHAPLARRTATGATGQTPGCATSGARPRPAGAGARPPSSAGCARQRLTAARPGRATGPAAEQCARAPSPALGCCQPPVR